MRKLALVIATAFAVPLFASSSAFAQALIIEQYATGSAITCVPMSTSTVPVPWVQTHGKVMHNTVSTQDIVLFCSVVISTVTLPGAGSGGVYGVPLSVMSVKYVDPDATGGQANVLAELKYADDAGNMVELAVASSSAQSGGGTGISTMDANISGLDKAKGQIFVQLTLHRTSTGLFPAVYGFTLH